MSAMEVLPDPDVSFKVGDNTIRNKRYTDGQHVVYHMRKTDGFGVIEVLSRPVFTCLPGDDKQRYREEARKLAGLLLEAAGDGVELPNE